MRFLCIGQKGNALKILAFFDIVAMWYNIYIYRYYSTINLVLYTFHIFRKCGLDTPSFKNTNNSLFNETILISSLCANAHFRSWQCGQEDTRKEKTDRRKKANLKKSNIDLTFFNNYIKLVAIIKYRVSYIPNTINTSLRIHPTWYMHTVLWHMDWLLLFLRYYLIRVRENHRLRTIDRSTSRNLLVIHSEKWTNASD